MNISGGDFLAAVCCYIIFLVKILQPCSLLNPGTENYFTNWFRYASKI